MSSLGTFLSSDNLKHNYQFLLQRVEQRTGINPRKYGETIQHNGQCIC